MSEGFDFQDNSFSQQINEPLHSNYCYQVDNDQLENRQYLNEPENNMLDQFSQKQQSNILLKQQEEDSEKVDYKNLPKLIGNNFQKYIEQNEKQISISEGLKKFLNERKAKKDKDKKKDKQISTKISDLRLICQTDNNSKGIFKKYIKKQFIIDLIHSTKIENPLKYIDGISTYFAAAEQPEKMISSHIISSKRKQQKK
ncbi:unnamed protein product [Paramecium sonneborni]|uniref:Uncharacterized protein n=1 Tax=Paramecium sonneborni TaxID=65129 RepID=A0A8S1QPM4_9CILI|nr:unnamed protein product [Paramecium sonneborni]